VNEVRRDKERLQITVRGEQRRAIEVRNKRKTLITEESEKIFMDFKETIQPAAGAYSSRSHLHTPKGSTAQLFKH
jgi:PHD/YefM family antitoxin component YafN of YafNO toxin-antitoxin module